MNSIKIETTTLYLTCKSFSKLTERQQDYNIPPGVTIKIDPATGKPMLDEKGNPVFVDASGKVV